MADSPSATYRFIVNKVDSFIGTPTIYPFVISNFSEMTVSQVADEVLYTGLIEMQELDASGQDPLGFEVPPLFNIISRESERFP